MILSAIVTRCQSRFRDTGSLVITEPEWEDYINDTYMEVLTARPDWPFMETLSVALTITAGGSSVSLPADSWRVTSVYNATDKLPLIQVDGRDEHLWLYPDPDNMPGTPQVYRLRGSTLEVYPRPAQSTDVVVEHFAPPAPLTSAEEPVFPEQYHRLLISGALQLAYADSGNLQQARAHQTAKDQVISGMAIDLFGPRNSHFAQPLDSFFY